MTADRIAAIRARLNKITPWPWFAKRTDDGRCGGIEGLHNHPPDVECWDSPEAPCPAAREIVTTDAGFYGPLVSDAEFIAHAPTDIADLLQALEESHARVKVLEAEP